MAERRMFAKTIIDSDVFLDMPLSTQCLYFHLSMRADDDGFLNNCKKIQRIIGASDDDLRLLMAKKFIIPFESGIVVIKHWKIHNYIRSDRYKPTVYQEEKEQLIVKNNRAYSLNTGESHLSGDIQLPECYEEKNVNAESLPVGIPDGYHLETQVRLGKDRLGKDRLEIEDDYCAEPQSASAPPVVSMILNDGTYFDVSEEDFEKWSALYPAVDVMRELRKMVGWCDANPKKRKTKRGIRAFINSWLAKEQDFGKNQTERGMSAERKSGNIFMEMLREEEERQHGSI